MMYLVKKYIITMCINCNLVAPIEHNICDLLGIPRNVYGVSSCCLDILSVLLSHLHIMKKNNRNMEDSISEGGVSWGGGLLTDGERRLYDYLVENDLLHHIENDTSFSIVDHSFINFVSAKYFEMDWKNDPDIVDKFRVPVELLTSDVERLRGNIGRVTYKQVEVIPWDLIVKWKVKSPSACGDYGLVMLPEQRFLEGVEIEPPMKVQKGNDGWLSWLNWVN